MPELGQRLEDLFAIVQRILLLLARRLPFLPRGALTGSGSGSGGPFFPDVVQDRDFQVRHVASTCVRSLREDINQGRMNLPRVM